MAKGTIAGAAVPQAKPRGKRLTLFRLVVNILLIVGLVLAVFYGLGGWYFSTKIWEDAFLPDQPTETEYNVAVTDVGDGTVTLRAPEGDEDLNGQGIRGMAWDGGYGQVDQILAQQYVEVGDELQLEVVRSYQAMEGTLSRGTRVDLESYAYPSDPQTAFGIPYETITYDSDLGPMTAWYVRGSTPTWMIFVHGMGSPLTESLRLLPMARERNYNALVINYRNDPGNPVDPSGTYRYGQTEWADLDAAAFYARENGAQEVVLVGYSMGGAIVAGFLAESPLRNHVSAAILDSPVLDLEAAIDHNAESTNLPIPVIDVKVPSSLNTVAKWMTNLRFRVDWDDYDWLARANEFPVPMLIFHGTADTKVPLATSRAVKIARPSLVTLVETDADHVLSWNMDPGGYEAATAAFLQENVGVGAVASSG